MPTPTRLLKLLKSMMSPAGLKVITTVEENGQPRQVEQRFSNLSAEEALKELDSIVESQWPNENKLSEYLEDFRKLRSTNKESGRPKDLKTRFDQHPEEMKQRLRYSKLCYQAMRPVLKRRAEQEKLWEDLKKTIPASDANGERRRAVESYRFAQLLIETDGSKESENFNDKLFSLLAVASNAMTWDEFEQRRYQSGLKLGMSEVAAKEAARLERNYGMDAVVDIYKERVDKANAQKEQTSKAVGMILSGKETDLKKLTGAFELINDDGFELMFIAGSAYQGFAQYVNNYDERKDALTKQAWGFESLSVRFQNIIALAKEVISPYFAYLNPMELFNSNLNAVKTTNKEKRDYVSATSAMVGNIIYMNTKPMLEKYGPGCLNTALSTTEMLVYENPIDKTHSEIHLIGVDDLGVEQGIQMKLNENVPGRYVDADLDQDMKRLLEQYRAAAGENPSNAFAEIGAALNGLNGDRLGEKAEVVDCDRIGRKLRGLQKAAADYLAVDKDFVIDGAEACSTLANAVKKFTDKKLGQLDLVNRHIHTVQQQARKNEWAKDTYQRVAQTVATGELDAAMDAERGETKDEQFLEFRSDARIESYIFTKKNEYTLPQNAAAQEKNIEEFEAQNDKINKDIVAARVVQELLNSEEKLFPNPKDRCMLRQLSCSGNVETLVHMVRESESFFENVRALELSDQNARDNLIRDGVHKKVAKDILQTVMKQQKAISQQKETVNRKKVVNQKQRTNGNRLKRSNSLPQKKVGKGLPGLS